MSEYEPFGAWPVEWATPFISKWEGFRESAYQDAVGVWTIGYGHTGDVKKGDVIKYHEAVTLMEKDLEKIRDALAPAIKRKVSKAQFIALMSLAYNIGAQGVMTRCPKLLNRLNTGDYSGAATEFLDIVKAGGRVLPGLVARRKAEAELMRGGLV